MFDNFVKYAALKGSPKQIKRKTIELSVRILARRFVRRRIATKSKQSGTNFYELEGLSDVLSEALMNSSRPEQLTTAFT